MFEVSPPAEFTLWHTPAVGTPWSTPNCCETHGAASNHKEHNRNNGMEAYTHVASTKSSQHRLTDADNSLSPSSVSPSVGLLASAMTIWNLRDSNADARFLPAVSGDRRPASTPPPPCLSGSHRSSCRAHRKAILSMTRLRVSFEWIDCTKDNSLTQRLACARYGLLGLSIHTKKTYR